MSSRQEPDFVDQWEAAYRERIKQLEAQVTMLTDREQQAIASIAAYKQAYKERVGYLEGQVSALTEAAIQREGRLQQKQEDNYQLLMIHQNLLAEFKDIEPDFLALYEHCKPFTMTSLERLYSLYTCVEYIVAAGISGDLAECGVWRGGSCMLMALGLIRAARYRSPHLHIRHFRGPSAA